MIQQNFQMNDSRASLYAFKEKLEELNIIVPGTESLIMPQVVRIHSPLINGRTNYSFDFGVGNTSALSIEKKLQKSDIFMMTALKLAIQKYDPTSPNFQEPEFTYPDPIYFTAAVARQLNKIYQGALSFKTGAQVRMESLDTGIFRVTPGDGFAGTFAAPTDYPAFGPDLPGKGFFNLGQYPILLGENENKIILELGQGDISGIVGAGGAESNNLVLMALGWVYRGQLSSPECRAV